MKKLSTAELVAAKPSLEGFRSLPRFPIYVVCDNVRSLENVGQIFRLSDAARISRLFLCGITGYPPLPADPRPPHVAVRAERVIRKVAIDSVQHVPWEHRSSAAAVLREHKERGTQIVALEQTEGSIQYTEARYSFPVCLLLGHEREGVTDEALALADLAVQIPVYGMVNSLNVAMAYAIAVYELLRRYSTGGDN